MYLLKLVVVKLVLGDRSRETVMRRTNNQVLRFAFSAASLGRNFLATLLLATSLLFSTALAEPSGSLTPKLDPEADKKPAIVKPLQAGIQHTENFIPIPQKALKGKADDAKPMRSGISDGGRGFFGKMRGGAKTATTTPLKSGASNGILQSQATSGFGIIGVKFILANGNPPVINRVFTGTPADKVGMHPTDVIVAVDGVPTQGLSKEEVYDLIIGSPGTPVNVSIMSHGDFRVVTCVRMDINDITDPLVRRDYLTSM